LIFLLTIFIHLSSGNAVGEDIDKIREEISIPDSGTVQILQLDDGSTLMGRTVAIYDDSIDFETKMGTLNIPIANIKSIKETSSKSIKKGKYWFPNPNYTRLYFAPTGRMLKAGSGYFSDYYLFFPGFAVGVTDNITLGGGFSLFPGIPIGEQIYYFTPKIGVNVVENVDFAVGALFINAAIFDEEDISTFGIAYSVGTFGTLDNSISIGLGYGFAGGELADSPNVMMGGEARLSRRLSFVTENWFIPGLDNPLISFGVRFMGEALSVDFAFINTLSEGLPFPGVPYIDFVYNF